MQFPFFDFGAAVYCIDIVLNAVLFFALRRKNLHLWFLWFTGARLAVSAIRGTLFLSTSLDTYSRAYWLTLPILLLLEMAVIADLFPRIQFKIGKRAIDWNTEKLILWAGSGVFFLELALALLRNNAAVTVEGCVHGLVAAVVVYALIQDWKNLLAIGMLMITLFPVLIDLTPDYFQYSHAARFLPSYLFFAAQMLWLTWAYRQKEHQFEGGF